MESTLLQSLTPGQELDAQLDVLSGTWPTGLHGHLFLIGVNLADASSALWAGLPWGGAGVMTRVDLAANAQGRVPWMTRRLHTPDIDLAAALKASEDPTALQLVRSGFTNMSNTSMEFLGNRMVVTFDAGRLVEVDPHTLRYLSHVGSVSEHPAVLQHPLLPCVFTTGHPVEDPTRGGMWSCNLGFAPAGGTSMTDAESPLLVMHWDGEGELDWWVAEGVTVTHGIHVVTVTEHSVLFIETAYKPEPGVLFGQRRQAHHAPYTQVHIVRKEHLTKARRGGSVPCVSTRIPVESFHQFTDFRQEGEDLTFFAVHANGWDLTLPLYPEDKVWRTGQALSPRQLGFVAMPSDASPVGRYVIDGRTGALKDAKTFVAPERHWGTLWYTRDASKLERGEYLWQTYQGFDPELLVERQVRMYADHPHRVVRVEDLPRSDLPSSIACLRAEDLTERSSWTFPRGSYAASPCHVTDPTGGPGWVVVPLQWPERTELHVFEALNLGKGPIAVAAAPGVRLSYQLHSGWTPTLGPRGSSYFRPYANDLSPEWKDMPVKVRQAVHSVVQRYS
jgi:carotenoid cleavage dioxygenase-like enzyme